MTPSNDGSVIRLPFPSLTEERRRELVKQCKAYAEEARVAVRNARRDANAAVEKCVKNDSLPEDEQRRAEAEMQKLTDKYIAQVDEAFKKKEAEVMEIYRLRRSAERRERARRCEAFRGTPSLALQAPSHTYRSTLRSSFHGQLRGTSKSFSLT